MRLAWIVGSSLASWLVITVALDRQAGIAVLAGMLGPLVAVCATSVAAERTFQTRPEALTAMMITAFAAKLVFFMAYVTVMIRLLSLRPVPFAVSFTAYFIILYFIEALHLRRLFMSGMRT